MNSMKNYEGLRPFSATQLFAKATNGLMKVNAFSIAGAASARASVCIAIGSLTMLGFIIAFAAVAFVALVFGVGILGLMGAIGCLILGILIAVSVAAILIIGSIFVPAGFLLVGGFLATIVFSALIAVVDFLPGCFLVAVAFLALTLLAIFL